MNRNQNPMKLLQMKNAWNDFQARHPKFVSFLTVLTQNTITEGATIEISVTTAEGKELTSNLRVTKEDEELLKDLMGMADKIQ